MGGLSIWHWPIVFGVLAAVALGIWTVLRRFPAPWKTWRVVAVVFGIFFFYAIAVGDVAGPFLIFEGIGAGLPVAILAWGICVVHNRRSARRSVT